MFFVSDYLIHRKTLTAINDKKTASNKSARQPNTPAGRTAQMEYARKARHNLIKENTQAAKTITNATETENRRKYRKIYDQFFARGGVAWYEAITAQPLNQKRIFQDIEYFVRAIETAVMLQELKEKGYVDSSRAGKIERRLEMERMAILAGFEHYSPEVTHRQLMISYGTSSWADIERMKDIYKKRDQVTAETGMIHHVDHIIPIVNKKVCGLNNQFNLQVIPGIDNLKKSNKFNV